MQVKLIALVIILTFEKSVEFKETLYWMAQFIQRLLATPEVRGLNLLPDHFPTDGVGWQVKVKAVWNGPFKSHSARTPVRKV